MERGLTLGVATVQRGPVLQKGLNNLKIKQTAILLDHTSAKFIEIKHECLSVRHGQHEFGGQMEYNDTANVF